MQTQKNNFKNNVQINFIDIFWRMLIQWRIVICFSIIFGLMVSTAKYEKDLVNYRNALKVNTKQADSEKELSDSELEQLKKSLTATELNDVETAVFNQQKIMTDQKYLDSSILMQIDSQNKHVVYLDYYIRIRSPKAL